MVRYIVILLLVILVHPLSAQEKKPKLIVGIVVDQMRQDYLLRYRENFADDGFNRFLQQGFEFKNAHYNYVPTYTAPGHTAIYTGTTPSINGIISNSWFDQQLNENVYCAYDSTATTVGADNTSGKMSPHQLLTPTITDQLRTSSQMRAKVVGISIKDRGAIFPAGFLGKAYWFDSGTGYFVTSDFYHDQLPGWVTAFNDRSLPGEYKKQTWSLLLDKEKYTASGPDESPYEIGLLGKTTFPYNLSEGKGFGIMSSTPYGNDMVTEMAKAAVTGENLGMDAETDFLAVSFSSTDYIGHNFGPNSVEVQDTYLRLDKNLEDLFAFLDTNVGKGEYIVFLSSDHGVADVPKRIMDLNEGGGYLRVDLTKFVTEFLSEKYGQDNWVRAVGNMQVFLNRDLIQEAGKDLETIRKEVALELLKVDGIASSYTYNDMIRAGYEEKGMKGNLRRGFNQKRSGDILFMVEAGWLQSGNDKGTSHGTGYNYDTHIPILWYGQGIPKGSSTKLYSVTDITPTLAMILNIMLPSGVTGVPMQEVLPTDE